MVPRAGIFPAELTALRSAGVLIAIAIIAYAIVRRRSLRDVAGAVTGAVVDDQDLGADAAYGGRHLVEHVADVLGLVVGGDEDRDLADEALR